MIKFFTNTLLEDHVPFWVEISC